MAEIKLVAEARTQFGKGAARRIRREDKIPAVLYGHGTQPVHITLPGHESMLALRHSNALFAIELEGESHLAIAKDVQRDPIRGFIEHIDLLAVQQGEKVAVDVTVNVVGESAPGTIHLVEAQTLSVEAEATHLPESVDVDITGLEAGATVTAGDVKLPQGATLVVDADHIVVTIAEPRGEGAESQDAAETQGTVEETATAAE